MKQLMVPGVLVAIVASMLLPLPPLALDFLIVANLVLAFVLLASTVYIAEPMKLSSLPTILLLATLYRLALNISTSRQILSHGEAGQVIEAFGAIVIQGNILVGLVVFMIVSIVQFVVIAKGAERVAEVTARFTLDALPGKQMSIDADVRAGLLDGAGAQAKRQELQIESRFYGALDGAMKFIKGDALAGLVIVVLNLCGGFGVGVAMQGMNLKQAVTHYSVLSVGDALVAQLPALLNALAAGVIVTRVSRGDGTSLANELPMQLGQLRVVKFLTAGLAAVCAFLPGMPTLPFLMFGLLMLIMACVHQAAQEEVPLCADRFNPKAVPLIGLEFGTEISKTLQGHGKDLVRAIDGARERLYASTGVLVPTPDVIRVDKLGSAFCLCLRGIEVARESAQGTVAEVVSAVGNLVQAALIKHQLELVDDRMTRALLDILEREAPELVSSVVPGIVSITQISMILKELLREGVRIRNFDLILQALAEHGPKARNERALLEEVRVSLSRSLCADLVDSQGRIACYEVAPLFDVWLVAAEKEGKAIDPLLIAKLANEISAAAVNCGPVVVVVSKGGRAYLRDCLKLRQISATLLAYEEIPIDLSIVSQGRLGSCIAEEEHETIVQALAA
ncbi:MAG: flagellar biosynthesis protein FlhA [Oligoflexia bacterium]|nr:flagellar biosynthesis protein FlhA [Oligoflexia bacterium]